MAIAESASLLAPLLAIVVILAIDSIDEDDPWWYRSVICFTGLAAVGPIMGVMASQSASSFESSDPERVLVYTILALILVSILLVVTTFYEASRGMEEDTQWKFRLITGVGVLLWYAILSIWAFWVI